MSTTPTMANLALAIYLEARYQRPHERGGGLGMMREGWYRAIYRGHPTKAACDYVRQFGLYWRPTGECLRHGHQWRPMRPYDDGSSSPFVWCVMCCTTTLASKVVGATTYRGEARR